MIDTTMHFDKSQLWEEMKNDRLKIVRLITDKVVDEFKFIYN